MNECVHVCVCVHVLCVRVVCARVCVRVHARARVRVEFSKVSALVCSLYSHYAESTFQNVCLRIL